MTPGAAHMRPGARPGASGARAARDRPASQRVAPELSGGLPGGVAFPRAAREIPDPIPGRYRSETDRGDADHNGTPPHATLPPQTRAALKPARAELAQNWGGGPREDPGRTSFPPAITNGLLSAR